MFLKDMLSNESLNKLRKVARDENIKDEDKNSTRKKKRKRKRKNKKDNNISTSSDNNQDNHISKETNVKKSKTSNKKEKTYDEMYSKDYIEKPKHLVECPFCGNDNLEITANGYYICEDCGVKVEKI